VNTTADFLVDNCNYTVKLVEEWGCNLGEDAFLTEEVIDSRPETLSILSNVNDLDVVQGQWELDELVTDLHREWGDQGGQHVGSTSQEQQATNVNELSQTKQNLMHASSSKPQALNDVAVLSPIFSPVRESSPPQIPGMNIVIDTGPWSLDWLSKGPIKEGGNVFTSTRSVELNAASDAYLSQNNALPSKVLTKKKQQGQVKNSVGFEKNSENVGCR